MYRLISICAMVGAIGTACVTTARGQLPEIQLQAVFPPGGKAGTTVDLSLNGNDLDEATKLLFTHPGILAEAKMSAASEFQPARPISGQFTVKIAQDVPPGVYEVRVAGKYGVSNPRCFVVGAQNEIVEKEPNNDRKTATELPIDAIANGTADGDGVDLFKVALKKGQRVIVACRAHRIDSRMDPTLVVYDSSGAEIARSRDVIRRDPMVDLTVAADGEYYLQVFDCIYRGGPEHVYRLSATTGPHVDFVFPPSGVPGTKGRFTLFGRNLPGGAAANVNLDGRPLEQLSVEIEIPSDDESRQRLAVSRLVEPAEAGLDGFDYQLASPQGPANPVTIGYAAAPVVVEKEPNHDTAAVQQVEAPCEIVGQFDPRGDVDRFAFAAKKGDVYWIEVLSQRLGLATDPQVFLERVSTNEKGEETTSLVQEMDDNPASLGGENDRTFRTRSDDPTYRFTVPADGTYRLVARDLHYRLRGSPRFVYRLAIRKEQPDFRLIALPIEENPNQDPNQVRLGSVVLRKGGSTPIRILVFRRDGFDGDIEIAVEGLPAGVTASPVTIGGASTVGTLVLVAATDANDSVGEIKISGKSTVAGAAVARTARSGVVVWGAQNGNEAPRSRLAQGILLSVMGSETAPALVEAGEGKVWEISRGGRLQIPLKITRHGEFEGNLTLQPRGVPRNINVQNVNLDKSKSDGKVQVNISTNAAPGTYTFALATQAQLKNYRRNPQAADEAKKEKERIDKLAGELSKAASEAQKAKQAAEQAAKTAADMAKQMADAIAAADRELAPMQQAVNNANNKLSQAKGAAEKNAGDANLKKAVEAAQKEADEAAAKMKAAQDKKSAAEKASQEAQTSAKAAGEAKSAAEKAAQEAMQKSQRLEQVKQQVAQRAQEIANQSKPRNINVGLVSTPIVLRITPAPITVQFAASPGEIEQGGKLEVPVMINRMYGFNGQVDLQIAGGSPAGIKVSNLSIPANQNQGKLVLEANKDAAAGERKLNVEARMNFNGQINVRQEVVIRVVPKK
jgi:hypothetical protein